jgi:tetrahydromethanopterin S-methyltransferase subunit D
MAIEQAAGLVTNSETWDVSDRDVLAGLITASAKSFNEEATKAVLYWDAGVVDAMLLFGVHALLVGRIPVIDVGVGSGGWKNVFIAKLITIDTKAKLRIC